MSQGLLCELLSPSRICISPLKTFTKQMELSPAELLNLVSGGKVLFYMLNAYARMSSVSLWKYLFPLTIKEASRRLAELKILDHMSPHFVCLKLQGNIFRDCPRKPRPLLLQNWRKQEFSFYKIKIVLYVFFTTISSMRINLFLTVLFL